MNTPHAATLADLAAMGLLVGRRVRLLEDVGSFVSKGQIGIVLEVRTFEPRATVEYLTDRGVPWRSQCVESPFRKLELVGGDEDPKSPTDSAPCEHAIGQAHMLECLMCSCGILGRPRLAIGYPESTRFYMDHVGHAMRLTCVCGNVEEIAGETAPIRDQARMLKR